MATSLPASLPIIPPPITHPPRLSNCTYLWVLSPTFRRAILKPITPAIEHFGPLHPFSDLPGTRQHLNKQCKS